MLKTPFELAKYPAHIQQLCKHPAPPIGPLFPAAKRKRVDFRSLYTIGENDIPMLFEIASYIDKMEDSDAEAEKYFYAPVHIWDALGQMGSPDILPQVLEALNHIYWLHVEYGIDEIHNAIVQCGQDAFDQLIQAFQDETRHDDTRREILDALVDIQKKQPEYRKILAQTLMHELSLLKIGRRQYYGNIVGFLAELNVREALPLIEKAYAQGYIDHEYCPYLEDIQKTLGGNAVSDPVIDQLERDMEEIGLAIMNFDLQEDILPKQAILTVRKHRDLAIPSLIQIVRQATTYARNDVMTDSAIHFAAHLLAEFQAKEALPYLMESLSITKDQAWDLYMDNLYESMPGVLYRLMGNHVDDYDRMIRDPKTPAVLRSILLSSLPFLIKYENLSREKYCSLLHDYLRLGIDESNEDFVTDVICDIPNGSTSFMPLAKEAFDKELVEPNAVGWAELEATLLEDPPRYDNVLANVKSDYSDAIVELKGWFRYSEPKPLPKPPHRSMLSSLGIFDSASTPPQKVGRNDPCPCGSGKKYKKCCMK